MSKDKKLQVGEVTTNNTGECAETAVYLVDEKGTRVGVAILKTKPGSGLHYKFENTIKLLVK